jgi:hypothetical protein
MKDPILIINGHGVGEQIMAQALFRRQNETLLLAMPPCDKPIPIVHIPESTPIDHAALFGLVEVKRKRVYLDLDGVLNSHQSREYRISPAGQERREYFREHYPVEYGNMTGHWLHMLDHQQVRLLFNFVVKYRLEIVLSTSHRTDHTPTLWEDIFRLCDANVPPGTIIGITPELEGVCRGLEIQAYEYAYPSDGYCVLDDDPPSNFLFHQPLVRTSHDVGLQETDIALAKKMLNI